MYIPSHRLRRAAAREPSASARRGPGPRRGIVRVFLPRAAVRPAL